MTVVAIFTYNNKNITCYFITLNESAGILAWPLEMCWANFMISCQDFVNMWLYSNVSFRCEGLWAPVTQYVHVKWNWNEWAIFGSPPTQHRRCCCCCLFCEFILSLYRHHKQRNAQRGSFSPNFPRSFARIRTRTSPNKTRSRNYIDVKHMLLNKNKLKPLLRIFLSLLASMAINLKRL